MASVRASLWCAHILAVVTSDAARGVAHMNNHRIEAMVVHWTAVSQATPIRTMSIGVVVLIAPVPIATALGK